MQTGVVIVAAGRGSRAGGPIAKQWQPIAGRPVALWTLDKFHRFSPVVAVVPAEDLALAQRLFAGRDVHLVEGGADRAASVQAGLVALEQRPGGPPSRVLIHDVARPCVPVSVIDDVLAALDHARAAAPAVAVTDALWLGENGVVSGTRDRAGLFRAQTPQGFRFADILAAHRAHPGGAADDVQVARDAGLDVAIVPGSELNLKITVPADFARAAEQLEPKMDVRLGNGFDVHAFAPGDHVVLCGVKIPHDFALRGHSDADVGMHAVTDALYGAMAEGDIGRHFPPSDPQWKGADSQIFLRHAVELAAEKGYAISNVDCTLICEHPKVGPHAADMVGRMAQIMGVRGDQVSVKATTSEKLGFTGRKEGIAALATAVLVKS